KKSRPAKAASTVDGITRVMPDIPPAALSTITGRVRVNVRVHVDAQGNVTQATLEPPPATKYFTDRVLSAARAWKFPAGDASRDLRLVFDLGRDQMNASVSK